MTTSIKKSMRYKVAGHVFEVSQDISENFFAEYMENYAPFIVDEQSAESENLFFYKVEYCSEIPQYVEEICQDEEGQQIHCGTIGEKSVFDFRLRGALTGVLVCSKDYKSSTLLIPNGTAPNLLKFAVNNSLMVLYSIASSFFNTLLFHSAVVNYHGKGYMFLGKSGTGKSTHARLWLKYNEGSELLNDDNPVVRFFEDAPKPYARVYGSPWSGKTPCYKNEDYPLGGFVLLDQAPFNEIKRLRSVFAYAAIVPHISGKRWESSVADGLHKAENLLAMNVPIWHLDCLPDEGAAKLCKENVVLDDKEQ